MRHPVNGDAVLGNERVGMVAPLHIEAAFQFRVQRHNGKQAHKTDGVGIAQERGNGGNLAHIHFPAHPTAVDGYGLLQPLGNHRLFQRQLRHRVTLLRHGQRAQKGQHNSQYAIP